MTKKVTPGIFLLFKSLPDPNRWGVEWMAWTQAN